MWTEGLKSARLRRGLSARQLSALSGLSPSYITKMERGEIEPTVHSLASVARALCLTANEVYFCVMSSLSEEP